LDVEQQRVVSAFLSGQNVMVEAPPGTGKTYLGVALAASCIRHDVLSEHGDVLLLTFSKNARVQIEQEMARLFSEGKIDSKERQHLAISNYHSFFFDCLQKRKALWGVKGRIRVGSLKARETMLKKLAKKDGSEKSKNWEYALLSLAFALQRFHATDILGSCAIECPSHLKADAFDIAVRCLYSAHPHYDDFAPLMLDLLESSPAFLRYLRAKYPVIVLDEFQDTDRLQWEIINIWRPSRLVILYDRFQMIYEWRGSTLQRIDDLKKAFGPFQEFNLRTIHRNKSGGKGLAQFLLALREDNLHGENANKLPQSIHSEWLKLKKMEAHSIAPPGKRARPWISFILEECRKTKKLSAIITRGNDLSIKLQRMLSDKGKGATARPFFPCRRITSNDSIEEVLRDRVERLKSIHTDAPLAPWFGECIDILVGGKKRITVKRSQNKEKVEFASLIKKAIKTETCSLSDLLPIGKVDKTCWMKVQPSFDCLVNKACNWNINDLGDCLQSVIDISWQLSKHYNFCLDPDALYLFKVLTKAVYKLPPHVETAEAIERLEDALLQASFLALRRTSNFPVFLSAHQSKGREFDHVIIPWLANVPEDKTNYYEGMNQFGKITGDVMRDDEERRVLYVALSRAKERVTILYPEESPSTLLRQWGLLRG
jgi:hypothetical protein